MHAIDSLTKAMNNQNGFDKNMVFCMHVYIITMCVLFDLLQLPEDEDGQRAALGDLVKVKLLVHTCTPLCFPTCIMWLLKLI